MRLSPTSLCSLIAVASAAAQDVADEHANVGITGGLAGSDISALAALLAGNDIALRHVVTLNKDQDGSTGGDAHD